MSIPPICEKLHDIVHQRIDDIRDETDKIQQKLDDIHKKLDEKYVHQEEFRPVKMLVYGAVKLTLAGVVGALLMLVLSKDTKYGTTNRSDQTVSTNNTSSGSKFLGNVSTRNSEGSELANTIYTCSVGYDRVSLDR